MIDKERFLMYITVGVIAAIIVNGFVNKDGNLVQNLLTVLAYWMPSPMAPNSKTVYTTPDSKTDSDSGI